MCQSRRIPLRMLPTRSVGFFFLAGGATTRTVETLPRDALASSDALARAVAAAARAVEDTSAARVVETVFSLRVTLVMGATGTLERTRTAAGFAGNAFARFAGTPEADAAAPRARFTASTGLDLDASRISTPESSTSSSENDEDALARSTTAS